MGHPITPDMQIPPSSDGPPSPPPFDDGPVIELAITAGAPSVDVAPQAVAVRCGETRAEVRRIDDDARWTAQTIGGRPLVDNLDDPIGLDGLDVRHTYDRALRAAVRWVRDTELRRIAHEQVEQQLSCDVFPAGYGDHRG